MEAKEVYTKFVEFRSSTTWRSEHTFKRNNEIVRDNFIHFAYLTKKDTSDWTDDLLVSWIASEREKGVSDKTLYERTSAVLAFWTWGWRNNYIPDQTKVTRPKRASKKLPALKPDEVTALIVEAGTYGSQWRGGNWRTKRNQALVAFLVESGLRNSELRELRWRDLPFVDEDRDFYPVKVIGGKGNKDRTSAYGRMARDFLIAYRDFDVSQSDQLVEMRERIAKLGKAERPKTVETDQVRIAKEILANPYLLKPATGPDDFVFPTENGDQLGRDGVSQLVKRIGRSAGLKVSPHKLRRTMASILDHRGSDLRSIQRQMGHSSISQTEAYISAIDSDNIEWFDGMSVLDNGG